MVMPQHVLYTWSFYDEHHKEIDDAAEAWGYTKLAGESARPFHHLGFIAFERSATTLRT